MVSTKEELSRICQVAMQLLKNEQTYTQVQVIEKMQYLGHTIAESTFTNILQGSAGFKTMFNTAHILQTILAKELGMEWNGSGFLKTAVTDFKAEIIPLSKSEAVRRGYVVYEEERLSIYQKVAFFKDAQEEVIEFGLTLGRFASNLATGNKKDLRAPIEELLSRGVDFKCFLVTISQQTSWYFSDRALVHPEEEHFRGKREETIRRLTALQLEFDAVRYPGKFEVYEYSHFPYGYFMAVDPNAPNCRMVVSPYLYGIRRKEAPVFKIIKKDNPILCNTYLDSLTTLTKNAKRILPPLNA